MPNIVRFACLTAMCCVSAVPALAEIRADGAWTARENIRVSLRWTDVPRWFDVRERVERTSERALVCEMSLGSADSADCTFATWDIEIAALRSRPSFAQIDGVQRKVNLLPYVSDLQNWGMADRWATPLEMLTRGGDCEDYALTKYFALRDLGFPESAMRLAVVWDNLDAEQHAVLFVESGGVTWLLDNKIEAPAPAVAYAKRYRVIYELNRRGAAFAPAALGNRPGMEGPRPTKSGRMLVFKTRPLRRGSAEPEPLLPETPPLPAPGLATPEDIRPPNPGGLPLGKFPAGGLGLWLASTASASPGWWNWSALRPSPPDPSCGRAPSQVWMANPALATPGSLPLCPRPLDNISPL